MKSFLIIIFCQICITSYCQNTEIYLFDIKNTDSKLSLTNQQNVSNNKGYNNQPSFYNDTILTFVSTRNGQTDIVKYNIRDKNVSFLNDTPKGGEYSPLKIPNSKDISAIRLDNDGKQRLYLYNYNTGKSTEIIKDLVVAYYAWYNKNIIISSVIENDSLNLYVSNIKTGISKKHAINTGRSFHKIPNSDLVSFISKEDSKWYINSFNPKTGESKKIINTVPLSEDMCWLIDGTILMPRGNTIYKFNPKTDTSWSPFKVFENTELQNITRITTNAIGTLLALVSDVSPEHIVQQQVDAYNSRDLDAFMNTYSNNVVINYFPEKTRYDDKAKMKEYFSMYFKNTSDLNCTIKNRMILGNKVIDEEYILANGKYRSAVAIYEVNDDKITKVSFIKPENKEDPVTIVDKQLKAYNTRNIKDFLATYNKTITLNTFPNTNTSVGLESMRNIYGGMFNRIHDLNAEIIKRIVIGNTIIDKEKVTVNGSTFFAIAIYEVKDGLIDKVTFIQ